MYYLVFILMSSHLGGTIIMPKPYLTEAACQADGLANNARINGARINGNMLGNSETMGFACVFQSGK